MNRRKYAVDSREHVIAVVIGLLFFTSLTGCQTHTTGLQKSVARGDETSVIATMKTIAVAQQGYAVTNEGNYGTFSQLSDQGFLDGRFNADNPKLHGYVLTMNVGEKTYSCNADPTAEDETRGRHFYLDSSSNLIKVNTTQPATAKDEILKF